MGLDLGRARPRPGDVRGLRSPALRLVDRGHHRRTMGRGRSARASSYRRAADGASPSRRPRRRAIRPVRGCPGQPRRTSGPDSAGAGADLARDLRSRRVHVEMAAPTRCRRCASSCDSSPRSPWRSRGDDEMLSRRAAHRQVPASSAARLPNTNSRRMRAAPGCHPWTCRTGRSRARFHVILAQEWAPDIHYVRDVAVATTTEL